MDRIQINMLLKRAVDPGIAKGIGKGSFTAFTVHLVLHLTIKLMSKQDIITGAIVSQ